MTAPLDRARLRALAQSATRYEGYSVDTEGNVWSDMNWRGMGRRKLTPFPNSAIGSAPIRTRRART